jgi:hypothetical protein
MTPPDQRAGNGAGQQTGRADDQQNKRGRERAVEDADVGHKSDPRSCPRKRASSFVHPGILQPLGPRFRGDERSCCPRGALRCDCQTADAQSCPFMVRSAAQRRVSNHEAARGNKFTQHIDLYYANEEKADWANRIAVLEVAELSRVDANILRRY